jgi:hypothetical protein
MEMRRLPIPPPLSVQRARMIQLEQLNRVHQSNSSSFSGN